MSISSAEFRKMIAKHFSPKLRELGWKGSGFDFRKAVGEQYIHLLTIQPSRYGGKVWVELGIHLKLFDGTFGREYDLKKIKTWDVEMRTRLTPKNNKEIDYAWSLEDSEIKNRMVIQSIWNAFQENGPAFFDHFQDFPGPFAGIEPQDLLKENRDKYFNVKGLPLPADIRGAWIMAQISLTLKEPERVIAFAELGLNLITGPRGSGMIPDFEKMIEMAKSGL